MKFASLAVLSYKRLDILKQSIQSIKDSSKFPYELLVADDGSDETWLFIEDLMWTREISTAIYNTGSNMGVGEAIHRLFSCAKGDYLVKLDADLIYRPGWLQKGVALLDKYPEIGTLGWFAYSVPSEHKITRNREDPSKDNTLIEVREDCEIVHDFVSSAMIIRREHWEEYGIERGSEAFAEDIGLKKKMKADGLLMAITKKDYIENIGFGLEKSVVVTPDKMGQPQVSRICKWPLLFRDGKAISMIDIEEMEEEEERDVLELS